MILGGVFSEGGQQGLCSHVPAGIILRAPGGAKGGEREGAMRGRKKRRVSSLQNAGGNRIISCGGRRGKLNDGSAM